MQFGQHSPRPAVRHRNFGTRQPTKQPRIALQSFRANLRNRQKMNERLFAEREIVQEIWKRTVPTRRNFAQRLFNLDRIERSLGFCRYPARLRAHRAFELTRKRDQRSLCESIFFRPCSSRRRSRRLKLARPRQEIFSSKGSISTATNWSALRERSRAA